MTHGSLFRRFLPSLLSLAVLVSVAPAGATTVPLGTSSGGIAVYYNDNLIGENPANQAYFRAQFGLGNTNGAEFNFDSTPLPGTGGLVSWYGVFQAVPDQFGFDAVLQAPTYDASVTIPGLHAYDNVNGSIAGRSDAGVVTWALSGYTGSTDGPADPANSPINSLFRGGTGPTDVGAMSVTVSPVSQVGTLFTVDVSGELISDGLIHWYTPATPDSPVGSFELTGKLLFSGTLTYDSAGPGESSSNLVDFYAGTMDVEAEVVCGTRYVNKATGVDSFPGPTVNFCRNPLLPCNTIQHAVDVACPGEVVNVAAGTYPEQVAISRAVTIQGAGDTLTIVEPTAVVANTTSLTTSSPIAAIVLVDGAEDVFLNDFKVDGSAAAFASCTPGYMGVFYRNASGAIDSLHVADVFLPAAAGCQSVVGIFAQSGGAGSADLSVTGSEVDNYGKNGITCNGAATSCGIGDSTVTGRGPVGLGDAAQNGIQFGSGAQGSIIGSQVTGNDYTPATWCATGILLNGTNGVLVQNNTVDGNLCDVMIVGDDNTIDGNIVDPAGTYPLSILGSGNTLTRNVVNGGPGDAVYVDGIDNTFSCNRVTNNGGVGIYIDTYSTAGTPNTLHSNSIAGNGTGLDASAVVSAPPVDAESNWWGCPAGANTAGCDTAVGNVDVTPPAAAPPLCVNCSADAECSDGLACTGGETCNLGTNTCQAGTPLSCPAPTQCEVSVTCQEPSGSCVATPKADGVLCSDGEACTLGDTCQSGVCTPGPGGDGDGDGDCDSAEAACGCNGGDASEVCMLPNRLVGLPGSGAGEVLLNWYSPTVRKVPIASDPSCATAGACTAGRCTSGKVYDLCTTNADCNQPAETCRVIVNYADTTDNALLFARFGKTNVSGFVAGTPSPTSPILVAAGCSKKVDVSIPAKPVRSNNLRLKAQGTIDGRLRRDLDAIQFRR